MPVPVPMDTPPAEGTYHRVMVHTIVPIESSAKPRFNSYSANIEAKRIKHPNGQNYMTIFFPIGTQFEAAAENARRTGRWRDVTNMWDKTMGEDLSALTFRELQVKAKDLKDSGAGSREQLQIRIREARAAAA